MNVIKRLPSIIIDQIAAGEVVEGPFSVVKELVENSIDAESTLIKIMISDGGMETVHIVDNGCGMYPVDLKQAFERHATSKIQNIKDLDNIATLGFRGEALPSIASVSQVKVSSVHRNNNNEGLELIIHGGELLKESPKTGNSGTSMQISNIFYNIPARKNFLKTINTEKKKIIKVVRDYIVANPSIAFEFYSDGKEIFKVSSGDLKTRILDVHGSNFYDNILPIKNTKDSYTIYGFIGNLNTVKKTRGNQYIYINGRSINSRILSSAAFTAYDSLLKRGEFPFFVIFIEMPHELVDVNVHPAKHEVRFSNEWQLYHLIKSSFGEALKDILNVIPSVYKSLDSSKQQVNSTMSFSGFQNLEKNRNINNVQENDPEQILKINERLSKIHEIKNDEKIDKTIWQIHNKYLITEINSGIIIVDQHVGHERVLYEQANQAINGSGLTSQKLLFPDTIKFSHDEYLVFPEVLPYLIKIGFDIREFGENTIIVEGIPSDMQPGKERDVINEIVEKYSETKEINSSFIDYMTSTYACKAAVKAGDQLSMHERKFLLDKLFSTEHPYFCPHGRPIIINLSIDELDKRFERK